MGAFVKSFVRSKACNLEVVVILIFPPDVITIEIIFDCRNFSLKI